jgi:hypothetical protein
MKRDWTGNSASAFTTLGVKNSTKQTDANRGRDFYATHPNALEDLLKYEKFSKVWEVADGQGHLCRVLKKHKILAKHSDIVYRGCKGSELIDFLKYDGKWDGDIITNPPYRWALEFTLKALDVIPVGRKVAFLLKIQFLEGVKRLEKLFMDNPPKRIYVWSSRIRCGFNGNFEEQSSAIMFAWFVWKKGFEGDPVIKWFGKEEWLRKRLIF